MPALKLMAVDDDPAIVELIENLVAPLGCRVLGCTDSAAAAEQIEYEKIHGIFIDVHMPGMDGFELARRVRASTLNGAAPIVLATGGESPEMMRASFAAGANFFVAKPFSLERLQSLFGVLRGWMIKAKIRHVRLPFRVSVNCTTEAGSFRLASLNLSEAGMLLDSCGKLSVGETLALSFALAPNPKPWSLRGRVVRKESADRVGIQFEEMEPLQQDALQRYLHEHLEE